MVSMHPKYPSAYALFIDTVFEGTTCFRFTLGQTAVSNSNPVRYSAIERIDATKNAFKPYLLRALSLNRTTIIHGIQMTLIGDRSRDHKTPG